jgi:long-chain acyl-CoA synthetase
MEKPWLEHYDEGVPETIDYPDITVDQFLTQAAVKHPNQTVTIFGARVGPLLMDAKLTYQRLNDAVNRFAAGLQQMGVSKGDRVAIMLPSCPQFIIAAYATWRIGGIVVCCNPLYVPREIEHLIKDSGTKTFIVMSSLYERVKGIRPAVDLKRVIVTNIKEYFSAPLRFLFTLSKEKKEGHRVDISGDADTHWFQDIMRQAPSEYAPVERTPEEVSVLIYTGGTTGGPKGAQLTHRNLVSNANALNIWAKSNEAKDVIISVMPFFHVYGLTVGMNTPIANALTIVLIPNPRDLQHVLKAIEKHRATFYPGVPTMVVGMNNFPGVEKYDLTSLRFAVSAAAPLAPEVQRRFEDITGCKMVEAYGLTETSPTATMDPIESPRDNSVGLPIPDTDVKIVDVETGAKEMGVGETGEIIIKGPQVMKGYWNMPEETANALRVGPDGQSGWLYSADIGYMDEDGYFHVVDRKKDMIIAGAYNIYPTDVEAVLFEHPKVKEAAVIGVPHERRGETIKAFIISKEGESATPDEIIAFCRERLAAYKVPTLVEFRTDLPKSLIGKVLRRELREEDAQKRGN